ncbi:hypothetical protein QIW49_08880, partial [Francisellaceae bacterium CB300]
DEQGISSETATLSNVTVTADIAKAPRVTISSAPEVTENGELTITATNENTNGRGIKSYNWPAKADLQEGWFYLKGAIPEDSSDSATLIAPAYKKDAGADLTSFSMNVTDEQGIISNPASLKKVSVTADTSLAPTVTISSNKDNVTEGGEITITAVTRPWWEARRISTYNWPKNLSNGWRYKDNAEAYKSLDTAILIAPAYKANAGANLTDFTMTVTDDADIDSVESNELNVTVTADSAKAPKVTISSNKDTVTEGGEITITAMNENTNGRGIKSYNWPDSDKLPNGWKYQGDTAPSNLSTEATLIAPAYKANAGANLTGFTMTVTDDADIDSVESNELNVTVTAAPTVLLHGVDGAYTGTDVQFHAEVTQLGSRRIQSYKWYRNGVEQPTGPQSSWVMMRAPIDEPSFNARVEVVLDDGSRWSSETKKITLMLDSITLEAPAGFEQYVTSAAKYLNTPAGGDPDRSNAKFTARSTKLTIECDDGYGWLVSIKPPVWGNKSATKTPIHGVNKFYGYQDGTMTGSYSADEAKIAWGRPFQNKFLMHQTILGCWKL